MASYKSRLIMHLNLGPKGSTMVSELVDYPGIQITDNWDKKKRKTERTIFYKDKEFPNIASAVEAWNQNKNQGGLHGETANTN